MAERFLELDGDIQALYQYAGGFLESRPYDHLLAIGYLIRLSLLDRFKRAEGTILLSNPALLELLTKLPVEFTGVSEAAIDQEMAH